MKEPALIVESVWGIRACMRGHETQGGGCAGRARFERAAAAVLNRSGCRCAVGRRSNARVPGLLKHAGMGSSSSDTMTFFVFFLSRAAVQGLCFRMASPRPRAPPLLLAPGLPAGVSGLIMDAL